MAGGSTTCIRTTDRLIVTVLILHSFFSTHVILNIILTECYWYNVVINANLHDVFSMKN